MHLGVFQGERLSRSHDDDASPAQDFCGMCAAILGTIAFWLVVIVGFVGLS